MFISQSLAKLFSFLQVPELCLPSSLRKLKKKKNVEHALFSASPENWLTTVDTPDIPLVISLIVQVLFHRVCLSWLASSLPYL